MNTSRRRSALARGQGGFAVPTVLFLILAGFATVTVGAVSTIRSQSGAVRDQDTKSALAAADAGAHQALLHYNKVEADESTPCLVAGAGGTLVAQAATPGTWCPAVSGSVADGTYAYGTYSYEARPSPGTGLEIVSTGTADGVSRRVELTTKTATGGTPFADFGVIGRDGITLDSNAHIDANVGTNGNITMASNSGVDCDVAQVGVGKAAIPPTRLSCNPPNQGTLTLPPVNQGDAPTNNDNIRLSNGEDVKTGAGDITWNATSRQLSLNSNSTITLGGDTYSLCRLSVNSNAAIYIAAGAQVRIFFDAPENCVPPTGGLPNNTAQLELLSNTRLSGTSGESTSLAMLFVGSQTRNTRIELDSNTQVAATCEHQFIVYAPLSVVDMDSNSTYCGAIAAKTLHLDSNSIIQVDDSADDFTLPPAATHYVLDRYVECTIPATGSPDAGC